MIAQVGAALGAAHARELVHRDVKPANVLVTADGHCYLTDFGLVKDLAATAGATQSGDVLGTLDYVAPERVQGGATGPWTDVYALGCVLFFALTGSVVFPLDAPESKLWAHVSEPPPSVSAARPGIPEAFDDVVRTALAKAPGERYASTAALVAAVLEAASSGAARPAGRADRRAGRGGAPQRAGAPRGAARLRPACGGGRVPGDRRPARGRGAAAARRGRRASAGADRAPARRGPLRATSPGRRSSSTRSRSSSPPQRRTAARLDALYAQPRATARGPRRAPDARGGGLVSATPGPHRSTPAELRPGCRPSAAGRRSSSTSTPPSGR